MSGKYCIDCCGDVCVGDKIEFKEGVFRGSYQKPKHIGDRIIVAEVVKDSYGKEKQQHTFTLIVISCVGVDLIPHGKKILRKGRNIYRHYTRRKKWKDEDKRVSVLEEKHRRGDFYRQQRTERREEETYGGYNEEELLFGY